MLSLVAVDPVSAEAVIDGKSQGTAGQEIRWIVIPPARREEMVELRNYASTLSKIVPSESKDEFIIIERVFSDDDSHLSIGLANIRAIVPDIEANKDKMARALEIFKAKKVNVIVEPGGRKAPKSDSPIHTAGVMIYCPWRTRRGHGPFYQNRSN